MSLGSAEALAERLRSLNLEPTRADEMPPGSVCGYCVLHRHLFIHPHLLPWSRWSLEDGCPCCETHVGPGIWPDEPALGCADA